MPESDLKTCVVDGVIFSEDGKTLIKMPIEAQKSTYIVPEGVERIATRAFEDCSEITTIIFPEELKYIEDEAFKNCTKLYSIALPSGLYDIGARLFTGCNNLTILTISCDIYGFMDVWEDCLDELNDDCSIYLDDYYYSCGFDNTPLVAFQPIYPLSDLKESMTLDKTVIPEGTTVIEESAYAKRKDISHVVCPSSLVCIKKQAFANCKELSDIVLSPNLQEIDDYAFANCRKLTKISLPEGLRRIGLNAFLNTSITSIDIPSTTESIDVSAFKGCASFSDISVSPNNPNYSSLDGILYNKDQTELILVPCQKKASQFVIPDSVLKVSENAFVKCENIKQLYVNDAIHDFPLSIIDTDLTNLESIQVNPNCNLFQLIDGVLFSKDGKKLIRMFRSSQVSNYVIPSSVINIHSRAFYGCWQLETITIPQDVKYIGKEAFYGCKNITSLIVLCDPSDLGYNAFSGVDNKQCAAYVKEEAFVRGFKNTALNNFNVYSIEDKEGGNGCDTQITEVNVADKDYAMHLKMKSKIIGDISLKTIEVISHRIYDYLDISEATFGYEMERWSTCLGFSHSGPVYGNSGVREVDTLVRFISSVRVATLVLPDDVMRRHINAAKKNLYIKQLIVRDSCKLFVNQDGKLMNKKKTIVVF